MSNQISIAPINKDLNVVKYEIEDIKKKIYTIRGKQVMLDSDVAMLYNCETRTVNQAVKRNIERFPDRFCFKLTQDEFTNLKSQFVISSFNNKNSYGGRRKLPFVFTEQGIAMISGLLKSEIAIQVSINIMDAFIEMRKLIANNQLVIDRLNNIELKQTEYQRISDEKFETIFEYIENHKEENQKIFFEGQIYDAYSLIIDIIKKASSSITIIDNYIDDSILKMLTKKNKSVEVTILTSGKSNIQNLDVQKFNKEYPTLKIAKTNKFHDRFIIIDNKELYHCGASIKDLGKKCFAINKIEDITLIGKLINL